MTDKATTDVLERTEGGGIFSMIGMAFGVFGISASGAAIRYIMSGTGDMPELLLVFGLVFFVMGLAAVFGRAGWILDRKRGTVTRWYKVLLISDRTERKLADFREIAIVKVIRGQEKARVRFLVVLRGTGETFELDSFFEHPPARLAAERFAGFLQFPVQDEGTSPSAAPHRPGEKQRA